MTHPYNKHDAFLDRDLLPRERLEPARATLRYTGKLLRQFEDDLRNAGDHLTEEQLEIICRACDQALAAAENAAFLGHIGYNAQPLEKVEWR